MPLISSADASQIRGLFDEKLAGDVKIDLYKRLKSALFLPGQAEPGEDYTAETQSLLEEVAALSDHISLEIHDAGSEPEVATKAGIERFPAFTIQGATKGRIRSFGIPSGYEFSSLIQDLIDASTGQTSFSPMTLEALGKLPGDVHIQVFVTPT